MALGVLVPAAPAMAAGPAVVSVGPLRITDINGATLTSVNAATTARYRVEVPYSCSTADCTDVQIRLDPVDLDPYYNTYRREANTFTYTPPFAGAPNPTGSAYTGLTLTLPSVTAGSGGTFSITYSISNGTSGPAGGSFFPNGSFVQPNATITAANSDSPATATTTATWEQSIRTPALGLTGAATIRTDTEYTVDLRTSSDSGCVRFDVAWQTIFGAAQFTCAQSYNTTVQLPTNAAYVAGSGGSYDPATRTVTFAASGQVAAGGVPYATPPSFRVTFPSDQYPTTGTGCAATETFVANQTVTYLNGETRTNTPVSRNVTVHNCAPFGKAAPVVKTSHLDQTGGSVPERTTWDIPTTPGGTNPNYFWWITSGNQGNVPGRVTIADQFDQTDVPVRALLITRGAPATVNYRLDDGNTGTVTLAQDVFFNAPAGRSIVSIEATSAVLAGPNVRPTDTASTQFSLRAYTNLSYGATPGGRSNTATASVAYPQNPEVPVATAAPATRNITLHVPTNITVRVPQQPTVKVVGDGTAVVGSEVNWTAQGALENLPSGSTFTPQYVFLAPAGWDILPNGASFVSGDPGATFTYRDVTVAGVVRKAVVVNWPAPTGVTGNVTLPQLQVRTTPTSAAPAGNNNQQGDFYVGDVNNVVADTFFRAQTEAGRFVDAPDIDADGSTADVFGSWSQTTSLAPTLALGVTKEICQPTPSAVDGCTWIANSSVQVGVPPTADAIKYRVTMRNNGNAALSNVVAYDVLPYIGDVGTSDATAGTPRGSTVVERLAGVSDVGTGIALAYSTSTNPPRPNVYSGATTGTWTDPLAGASSIRATIASLPAFSSRSFVYTASLVGAGADEVACNSVAVIATSLAVLEPAPVCATTQEADFSITTLDRLPLQEGRVGVVPFEVINNGGSEAASGTVVLDVPEGLEIADLDIAGWDCDAAGDPDVQVTCLPVNPDGTTRSLQRDAPETIALRVIPAAGSAETELCIDGAVSGLMFDPALANNETAACSNVVQGDALLNVTKGDGRDSVEIGDEFTYTITVQNALVGESLADVTVTDALPASLAFVSATAGGAVSGQGADGSGGTVTWTIDELLAAAAPSADGTPGDPVAGSSVAVSVTVRVLQSAESLTEIANTATATAADPAGGDALSASDDDVNDVVVTPALTLQKSVTPTTASAVGDVVTYSFLVTNTGDVNLSALEITEDAFSGSGDLAVSCPATTLAPLGTVTCTAPYTLTQADVDAGTVTNTATASATAPAALGEVSSTASTATVTIAAAPALTLTKSAGDEVIDSAGDTVSYSFLVTNTGNVTLSDVAIDETAFTGTGDDVVVDCPTGDLAPGAFVTCTATYEVTQADVNAGRIDNTAVAVATTPAGADVSSAASSATVIIDAVAGLSVVKSATPTDLVVDQEVTYSFVVTNTGEVTLEDVTIDEVEFTGTGDLSDVVCAAGADSLDPDDQVICSATYTITQADVDDGTLSNTATATAVSPGGPITSAPSSVQLPFEQEAGIQVVKSADVEGYTAAGDAIEYRFRITNTGNVSLTEAEVIEQDFSGTGDLSAVDCATGSLLPGQFVDCTAEYEVTQADVDAGELTNSATATGVAPGSAEPIESELSELVLPFTGELALTLTKAGTPVDVDGDGRTTAADRIQWSFTVTNPSAATLSDVTVVDPMAGEIVCEATVLAPGDSVDCAAVNEYDITAEQGAAGEVRNVASATALGVGAVTVTSADAAATVEIVAVPTTPTAPGDGIAATGMSVAWPVILLAVLVLLGAGVLLLVWRARSRRREDESATITE